MINKSDHNSWKQYLIKLLDELISVPRHSKFEEQATLILENFINEFNSSKFRLNRYKNNLILLPTFTDSEKPTILLNSHIDTVKPVSSWTVNPYNPLHDQNRIIGIGSNDAGASLVTLLGAFLYIMKNGLQSPYNIIFAASAEEEISGENGIESIVSLIPKIDFAIVGEPTGMNPAIAEKGLMVIDATIKGKSGHAAREEGDNAIYKALPVISSLRSLRFPQTSEWLGPVKISVTQINAGTQHNVVPDKCTLVIDVRTTDCYTNSETFEIIKTAMPDYCILTPRSLRLNPSRISLDNILIKKLIDWGKVPFGSPTLSDQSLMPWPSFKLGPGDSRRSHTANEYILISEIHEAFDIYLSLLTDN